MNVGTDRMGSDLVKNVIQSNRVQGMGLQSFAIHGGIPGIRVDPVSRVPPPEAKRSIIEIWMRAVRRAKDELPSRAPLLKL